MLHTVMCEYFTRYRICVLLRAFVFYSTMTISITILETFVLMLIAPSTVFDSRSDVSGLHFDMFADVLVKLAKT